MIWLQKIKPTILINKLKVSDESEKDKLHSVYTKLRDTSISNFCKLLKRHPHFNFRENILQTVLPKLASHDIGPRREVTQLLFDLLGSTDQSLLDFKVDILKELNDVVKTKPHKMMDPKLLDCLVLHLIVVDEDKARAIQAST